MKINPFFTVISVLIAALLAYLLYYLFEDNTGNIVGYSIIGGIAFLCSIEVTMGIKFNDDRIGVNAKVLSNIFFFIFLIIDCVFAAFDVKLPIGIIVNGILLLVFISIIYKMSKAEIQQEKRN